VRAALQKFREEKEGLRALQFAVGVNSTVDAERDLHIIMLDYDTLYVDRVEESVREVQQFWRLGPMCIYRTKHGYHAIGWYDAVPYERLRMIVDYAKDVDPLFKHISRRFNHKTLRVSGKHYGNDITFYCVIDGVRPVTDAEFARGELLRTQHAALIGDAAYPVCDRATVDVAEESVREGAQHGTSADAQAQASTRRAQAQASTRKHRRA
jgi:hypothetical protein